MKKTAIKSVVYMRNLALPKSSDILLNGRLSEFHFDNLRRRLFRFYVSGDNQPFSLERTERLCHFHPNCLMSC
jgi:hypothetical protein